MENDNKITFRSMFLGTFFAVIFAIIGIYFESRKAIYINATQIAILPYLLLFTTVLLLNPLCNLIRFVRKFTATVASPRCKFVDHNP